jgi:hypothetical protein
METVFSVGSILRLYNKDPRPAEIIIQGVSWDGSERWLRRDGSWDVSWVSGHQSARMSLGAKELNWGITMIECSSVELKVCLWREDFMCAVVLWYLECVIQWDFHSSCVKIHCQEMGSGDCNRLRTLVLAAVNCKSWRLAVVLYYL